MQNTLILELMLQLNIIGGVVWGSRQGELGRGISVLGRWLWWSASGQHFGPLKD